MHHFLCWDGNICTLWRPPLKTWIQPLPDPDIKQKNPRGHEYQTNSIMASFQLICHIHFYRNRARFRIHRPSVEKSPVLIVASVKYNRGSEKNIENCFFHINFRPGAWTSCNKGVMQKLKRHGNGESCLKKHENFKIKIFAERVMESHIYIYI